MKTMFLVVDYLGVCVVNDVEEAMSWCEKHLGAKRDADGRPVLFVCGSPFCLKHGDPCVDRMPNHISLKVCNLQQLSELMEDLSSKGASVRQVVMDIGHGTHSCIIVSPQGLEIHLVHRKSPLRPAD